jgi:quercetin 2,3-dioxygenase
MISIRRSDQRGRSQLDWLNSYHTFSFAEYRDPEHMGFGHLRVINEDMVQPGMGFARHAHRDMDIISYVVEGELEHQDSMGNGSVIKPGDIQIMTAGTGIEHSEFNRSKSNLLHFLQIWIIPKKSHLKPSYQQKTIQPSDNELILIGCQDPKDTAVTIHQDACLYVSYMQENHSIHYSLDPERMGWLQLIKGHVLLNGADIKAGDGAAIQGESTTIDCLKKAELLFFDLAATE